MSRGLTILTEIWADIGTRYPLLRNKVFLRNYALSMFMEKSCYGRIRNAPDPYMDVLIKYRRHRAYKAGPCSEELRFGCCYGAIIQYLTRTSREGSVAFLEWAPSWLQMAICHRMMEMALTWLRKGNRLHSSRWQPILRRPNSKLRYRCS